MTLRKTRQIMDPSHHFNRNKDPRIQRILAESGTLGVILTHESVGPEYIALWLSARLEESREYDRGLGVECQVTKNFTEALRLLDMVYPPAVPATES